MRFVPLILVLILAGCTPPRAGTPLTQSVIGNDLKSRLTFQREITDRRICTNDDAFHMLIVYVNQNDPSANYDDRTHWLRDHQMLPDGFNRPADEAVTRGVIAVAIAHILHIHGGVMMHVLPLSERYATRELVYRGVYPPDSTLNQTYSGLELVGVLAQMEDFQQGDPANLPASQLPQEPEIGQ